jgi:hypothetical protein
VLVAFTRPELLLQVLAGLRQQTLYPPRILAFVDGPRHEQDIPLIDQCISLLTAFSDTIPVDIQRRPHNRGCDQNVVASLTEAFSHWPELVYVEDDIVPNPHFYETLCRLLAAYRHHPQVFSVSAYATCPVEVVSQIDTDFMISRRVFACGWATWADRWQSVDLENRVKGAINPFGEFYKIPATLQTQYTMINQFWLEKNHQTDWVITMTLAALQRGQVHVSPTVSLVRNIGFGHPQAKTYRGPEPAWVNAKYEAAASPDRLPASLKPVEGLRQPLTGTALARYFSKQGLWLSPDAVGYLLQHYPDWSSRLAFLSLFLRRIPLMLQRWRQGLPI